VYEEDAIPYDVCEGIMKKSIKKPYNVWCETLKANVWVFYGFSRAEYTKSVSKYFNIDTVLAESTIGKMEVFSSGREEIICVWTENKDISVLAHEIIHAMTFLLDSKGVPISYDNDEILCYYVEWMLDKVLTNEKKKRGRGK